MSLTIVIPNRNRNLATVKRSLDSLAPQLSSAVTATVVDYGSEEAYQQELEQLIRDYEHLTTILCPTQGQLWNKSRCINMVLKTCTTSHFMVCDMDMLWHPDFIKLHLDRLPADHAMYFTVGVMTQQESALDKTYHELAVKFKTNNEATGITIFPTDVLKSINGFDEFYHGWGSEDTDVHSRLRNAGYEVRFRESETYFKHQWHEKGYRSTSSTRPFHPFLERINNQYYLKSKQLKMTVANTMTPWGLLCDSQAYAQMQQPTQVVKAYATYEEIHAVTQLMSMMPTSTVLHLEITTHPEATTLKTKIKKLTGKKTPRFLTLDQVNEHLLEQVVQQFRNCPYHYTFIKGKAIILVLLSKKASF